MKTIRTISAALLAAGMALGTAAFAQQPTQHATPNAFNEPRSTASDTWTPDQLITASVHDAWMMSGKNVDTFFKMVSELAQISAQKRGLTLPNDEASGKRFGELIKTNAKADTDQLLYVVVDKAVQQVGTKGSAGTM